MISCLKCKTRMRLFSGSSMMSALASGSAEKVEGYSCPNCSTWVEIPVDVSPQRFKAGRKQTKVEYGGLTSKQYGALMREQVEARFDEILAVRSGGATYKAIVIQFGLTMSSTTCERHMTLIRREKKIDGYFFRGTYYPDKPDSADTIRRRGVAPKEKSLSKCQVGLSVEAKSRRVRRNSGSSAGNERALSA